MPELPEVETVRRGLLPVLEGKRIVSVEARRPDLRFPLPPRFAERLTGRRVVGLERRAKYILAGLDNAETLLIHLGMSGRITVSGQGLGTFHHSSPGGNGAPGTHDHILFSIEGGARITYSDHRRFGAMDLIVPHGQAQHRLLAKLGPEPLSSAWDARVLRQSFAAKRTPVKAALLDQRLVAGLGNIYVCEALHRTRISPERLAGSLTVREAQALTAAVKAVLLEAIGAGGSTLRDFQHADGELGYFQHAFRVYGREGAPCPTRACKGQVQRLVQSGRSSFYCPRCQR